MVLLVASLGANWRVQASPFRNRVFAEESVGADDDEVESWGRPEGFVALSFSPNVRSSICLVSSHWVSYSPP